MNSAALMEMVIIVIGAVAVLYSIIIHEITHGYVARLLGDDTATVMGRLTLNPLAHIDIFGTIVLPLILLVLGLPVIGWAKPVPVNPSKMEQPRQDYFIVALAGPLANFFIALVFGLVMRFVGLPSAFESLFVFIVEINLVLMIFNLIPIPPLDGSKVLALFLPQRSYLILERSGLYILLALVLFSSFVPVMPFIMTHVVGFFFHLITNQVLT